MNSKMVYGFQHGPKGIAIYLWPLDLVKSNIPVLHSLSSEGRQNNIISIKILPSFRTEACGAQGCYF